MVEKGIAKSPYDAAKKIADQTGETVKAVEHRIARGKKEIPQGGEQQSNPPEKSDTYKVERFFLTWPADLIR